MSGLQALAQAAADLQGQGKFKEAAEKYDEILKLNDGIAEVHVNKGVMLSQAGDSKGALKAFLRACELKPELANAHSNAANVLRDDGDLLKAADKYRDALKRDGAQKSWWTSLCNCLNAADACTEALEAAEQGLEKVGFFAPLHNERIFALFKLNRPDEAISSVDAILKETPFPKLEHDQRALYAMLLSQRGSRLLGSNKASEALAFLQRACDGDASADNMFPYGVCLLQLGKDKEGIETLTKVTKLDPGNWRVWVALGSAQVKQAKFKEACESFEKAFDDEQPSRDSTVNFNYAVALMNSGRDKDALQPLELVVSMEPDNHVALALLAMLMLQNKDYAHAVELLERAAETPAGKNDPSIHYNLGYARLMTDQPEPALESFEESLRLDPTSEQAKVAVQTLEPTALARKDRLTKQEIEAAVKAAKSKNAQDGRSEKEIRSDIENADDPLARAKAMLSSQRPPFLRRKSMEGIQLGYVVAMAGAYDEITQRNLRKN